MSPLFQPPPVTWRDSPWLIGAETDGIEGKRCNICWKFGKAGFQCSRCGGTHVLVVPEPGSRRLTVRSKASRQNPRLGEFAPYDKTEGKAWRRFLKKKPGVHTHTLQSDMQVLVLSKNPAFPVELGLVHRIWDHGIDVDVHWERRRVSPDSLVIVDAEADLVVDRNGFLHLVTDSPDSEKRWLEYRETSTRELV